MMRKLSESEIKAIEDLLNTMYEGEEFTQDNVDGASYVLNILGYEVVDVYDGGYGLRECEK